MENKLIKFSLTAVIGVILLGALLVPVISTAIDEESAKYNNDGGTVSDIVGMDYVIEYTADHSILVNGDDRTPTSAQSVLFTDKCLVIWFTNNLEIYGDGIQGFDTVSNPCTITITDGVVNIDTGSNTYSYNCSWGYIRDVNGSYQMYRVYNSSKVLYVNSIDDLKGANYVGTTQQWYSYEGSTVYYMGEELTANYDLVKDPQYRDLYTIRVGTNGTYSFDVDNSGTPYTVHPWVIVAPKEITAYTEVGHSLKVLSVIPALIIIALLASAVILVRSRD